MLGSLTLIVSCYVIVRMLELTSNESRSGAPRSALVTVAWATILLTFVSCSTAQLTGLPTPTP